MTHNHRALGGAVLTRLSNISVPASLKSEIDAFRQAHGRFEALATETERRRSARDLALQAIAHADEALAASVRTLADRVVVAKLGDRKNPFGAFGAKAPDAIARLEYGPALKQVRTLIAKVRASKPRMDVMKAAEACRENADALDKALGALDKPQKAFTKGAAAQDALLVEWTKALWLLRRTARAAWARQDATYRVVFEPVDAVLGMRRTKGPAS